MLSHYRGRSGQPVPVQAALHTAAVRLGDFHRGALQVSRVRRAPAGLGGGWLEQPTDAADLWDVEVIHHTDHGQEIAYRVIVAGSTLAPSLLSCSDDIAKAETLYETLSFSRA